MTKVEHPPIENTENRVLFEAKTCELAGSAQKKVKSVEISLRSGAINVMRLSLAGKFQGSCKLVGCSATLVN